MEPWRDRYELEDFFENGSIPMHWAAADGTILRANRAELELLGYAREEYVGRHIAEFHVDQAVIADILARLARNEVIRDGDSRASVLLFDEAGVMRFQAWRNLSDRYRAAVDGHSPWSRDTLAPSPIVIEGAAGDPALGALRDVVLTEGIRALAFVPLVSHGQLLGKFMVYYDAPHCFNADELRLASSIAQHVAFGVARV